MKTRIKVKNSDKHIYIPTGDCFLDPKNKRARRRKVRHVRLDEAGNVRISTHSLQWNGRDQSWWYEEEVSNWDEIVTPEALAHINPKRKIAMLNAYPITKSYNLTRQIDGDYTCGCYQIKRAQLIKVCKAILKDEGEI